MRGNNKKYIMSYQSEITVLITRPLARKISKHIANCGFVTVWDEVSNRKIADADQFRIVIYHESFKEYVCKATGYAITQFVDRKEVD